jgi:hypothetical protein
MTQTLLLVFAVAFAAALVVVAAIIWRRFARGSRLAPLFSTKPVRRRIDVVEQVSVDARRTLLLVRRDDVEHLIMTGGPVDIVVESGIGASGAIATAREPPVLTHPPLNGHAASGR